MSHSVDALNQIMIPKISQSVGGVIHSFCSKLSIIKTIIKSVNVMSSDVLPRQHTKPEQIQFEIKLKIRVA